MNKSFWIPEYGELELEPFLAQVLKTKYSLRMRMIVIVTSFFIVTLIGIVDSTATVTVHPQSVEHKYVQGSTITLACKANNTNDPTRWTINDQTLAVNCRNRDHERITLQNNCNDALGWFNLTVTKLIPEDKGVYTCANGGEDKINIDVLVPLMKNDPVKVEVIKQRLYHNTTESMEPYIDLRPQMSDDQNVTIFCTSSCAYPAPTIDWYSVVEGPEVKKLQVDSSKYHSKPEDCDGGLQRATSRLILKADEKPASLARQKITCKARQDLTDIPDGEDIFSTGYLQILYGDSRSGGLQAQPLSTLEISGIAVGAGVILLLVLLGVACFMWSRSRDHTQCEDPDAKEKMKTNDEPV